MDIEQRVPEDTPLVPLLSFLLSPHDPDQCLLIPLPSSRWRGPQLKVSSIYTALGSTGLDVVVEITPQLLLASDM